MKRRERDRGRRWRQLLLRCIGGTSAAVANGDITLRPCRLDATANGLVFSFSYHSFAPQLSVPRWRGRDGGGMGRSFGLAPCISETGQRGTQSHSAAGRTLDRFLELEVESGEHRFYTNNMTEKGTPLLFFIQFIYSMLFSIVCFEKKSFVSICTCERI